MNRKSVLVIVMIAVMLSGGGCGNKEAETTVENNPEIYQEKEVENVETQPTATVQEENPAKAETADIDSLIVEKTDDELDLKQFFYSYEDRSMDNEGERVFDTDWFEYLPEIFVTTGNVDLYNINGIRIGYTLENVEIDPFGEYNGWYYFYLDNEQRFARVEDVSANSTVKEIIDYTQEEINEYEESTVKTEKPNETTSVEPPKVDNTNTPAPPEPIEQPATSDKYTPEEAMAVYRSLMEAGGITWNPALKDVSSWGTGWIYLDKGQPEWAAETNLESAAIGGHGGNSWTQFYFEVTGSDEECVYVTEWHN